MSPDQETPLYTERHGTLHTEPKTAREILAVSGIELRPEINLALELCRHPKRGLLLEQDDLLSQARFFWANETILSTPGPYERLLGVAFAQSAESFKNRGAVYREELEKSMQKMARGELKQPNFNALNFAGEDQMIQNELTGIMAGQPIGAASEIYKLRPALVDLRELIEIHGINIEGIAIAIAEKIAALITNPLENKFLDAYEIYGYYAPLAEAIGLDELAMIANDHALRVMNRPELVGKATEEYEKGRRFVEQNSDFGENLGNILGTTLGTEVAVQQNQKTIGAIAEKYKLRETSQRPKEDVFDIVRYRMILSDTPSDASALEIANRIIDSALSLSLLPNTANEDYFELWWSDQADSTSTHNYKGVHESTIKLHPPRKSGYQSMHFLLRHPITGAAIEIQLTTENRYQFNNSGPRHHTVYKQTKYGCLLNNPFLILQENPEDTHAKSEASGILLAIANYHQRLSTLRDRSFLTPESAQLLVDWVNHHQILIGFDPAFMSQIAGLGATNLFRRDNPLQIGGLPPVDFSQVQLIHSPTGTPRDTPPLLMARSTTQARQGVILPPRRTVKNQLSNLLGYYHGLKPKEFFTKLQRFKDLESLILPSIATLLALATKYRIDIGAEDIASLALSSEFRVSPNNETPNQARRIIYSDLLPIRSPDVLDMLFPFQPQKEITRIAEEYPAIAAFFGIHTSGNTQTQISEMLHLYRMVSSEPNSAQKLLLIKMARDMTQLANYYDLLTRLSSHTSARNIEVIRNYIDIAVNALPFYRRFIGVESTEDISLIIALLLDKVSPVKKAPEP